MVVRSSLNVMFAVKSLSLRLCGGSCDICSSQYAIFVLLRAAVSRTYSSFIGLAKRLEDHVRFLRMTSPVCYAIKFNGSTKEMKST